MTFCDYFNSGRCKSCTWIEWEYDRQLLEKEQKLKDSLSFAGPWKLEPTVASSPQGFRNRAKMVVTGKVEAPVIGLTGESDLDQGREILSCPVHHPRLNELISALPEFIRNYQLIPYEIETRKGELKGLILFHSPGTDEMYLRFVLRSKECVSRIRKLLPALQERFPNLVCVTANLQPIPHAILEGPEEIFINERKTIDHRLGKVTLKLSPQAFVQTNVEIAIRLYQTAAEWITEIRPKKMLELYCGQGAFSFFAAKSAEKILGIEINPEAVRTANETATALGLQHVSFQCGDAGAAQEFQADLVLMNPPRRGLAEGVKWIQNALPKHLLYSSCAVETLAVDLQSLSEKYQIKKCRIFDMFPHTGHFETLVLLERKD